MRELETDGRAALLAPNITVDAVLRRELGVLPAAPPADSAVDGDDLRLQPQVDALEQRLILRALQLAEGNKA
ncbi:MAG: hypothetical protein C6Y20_21505, partial [Tagaea sp. CACIAM 22H2]|nr:hypothetical protein [Tagaea sp. CACIAM 22H2]